MKRVGPTSRPCMDGKPGHPIDRVRVAQRMCNHSAFNGYHRTPSDYSGLVCLACGAPWRTKAAYVSLIGGDR